MTLERSTPIIVVFITCALGLTVACGFPFSRPHPGKILNEWSTGNGVFKIRVIEREEEGGAFRAAMYLFQSASVEAEDWQDFLTVRDEEMPGIPQNQITFVGPEIAYVFMQRSYSITTDAGKSWLLWEGEKQLPDWASAEYGVIRVVALNADGSGTMTLGPAYEPETKAKLSTSDYGRSWHMQ